MKQFNLDPRNAGGRKAIEIMMLSHYKVLNSIRPVIDIRSPPSPIPRIAQTPIDFSEVSTAFKKVHTIVRSRKMSVNNSVPKTHKLPGQFSTDKAHSKSRSLESHSNHMWRMKRRVSWSTQKQKKNQSELITNPLLLGRNGQNRSFRKKKLIDGEGKSVKRALMSTIFDSRICRQEDLARVFEEFRETKKHLPSRLVEKAIVDAQIELNSYI